MNDQIIKLTNPEFDIEFDGKKYTVRKANLEKVVQYYAKVSELSKSKDPSTDHKLVAYCIYLVLHSGDASITEEQVLDKTPGDIDVIDTLTSLGFINPRKTEKAKQLQEAVLNKLTTGKSSPTSPSAQDGVPTPSENSPSAS